MNVIETVGADIGLVANSSAAVAGFMLGPVFVVTEIQEWKPRKGAPLLLAELVPDLCAFARRHGAHVINADHHVLEPARERLLPGFRLEPVDGGTLARARRFATVRALLAE